jgi:predicted Zn-dependent peptidase
MKNTKAVTVLVLVGTGSKYETKEINGISHFLEHMFFKGTKKRPTPLKLNEIVEKVGGMHNAFTSKEMTGYWVKVDGKHLDVALDWVSDVYLHSAINQKAINKERGVIIEEINMNMDQPMTYIWKLWEELLYGNQPAGWFVAGTKDSIINLKRDNFINYLKSCYSVQNTIVVVAGNIKKDLKNKVADYFKGANTIKPKIKDKVVEIQGKPELAVHYKKTDQTHFCLGVRGVDLFDKDKYVLDVLSAILGKGHTSRLFLEIREKYGLAYYIRTISDNSTDSGYLVTGAGVDNRRVDKAIQITLKNYKLLKDKKVGREELRKIKDLIIGRMALNLETSDDQAEFYGEQELLEKEILTLDEIFAKIEAVTAEDVQRVARDIFKPEKLNLALIGPFKEKAKFEKLLKL